MWADCVNARPQIWQLKSRVPLCALTWALRTLLWLKDFVHIVHLQKDTDTNEEKHKKSSRYFFQRAIFRAFSNFPRALFFLSLSGQNATKFSKKTKLTCMACIPCEFAYESSDSSDWNNVCRKYDTRRVSTLLTESVSSAAKKNKKILFVNSNVF